MFIEHPPTPRPDTEKFAVAAICLAASGFLIVAGFFFGIILGHIALVRINNTGTTGRGLAIAALWISYLSLIIGAVAFIAIVFGLWASLPEPQF